MSIYKIIYIVLFFLISAYLSYNEYKDTEKINYSGFLRLGKSGYYY